MAIEPHTLNQASFRHKLFRGILLLGFLISGLFLCAFELQAQSSAFDPDRRAEAAQIKEELTCFTDRGLYVVGESIRFSVVLRDNRPAYYLPWSRVLYVELVSHAGASLAGGKYPVNNGRAHGEIRIPADLLSGQYYLRSYTRWMRNFGPESYAYVPLRIMNPHRIELVEEIMSGEADANLGPPLAQSSSLEFDSHPRSFVRGEKISMQLQLPGDSHPEIIKACLTVISSMARPAQTRKLRSLIHDTEGDSTSGFQLNFLPDKFGPSLSGSVVYTNASEVEHADSRIHFTLLGETPGYLVCQPDESGRFAVALPYFQGNLELFVQPESRDGSLPEVRIDRDFDQRHLVLPASAFAVNEQDRQMLTVMARNVQLSGIYQDAAPGIKKDAGSEAPPFYGIPTLSVDLDRYVLLPTLEEVFMNLVPTVSPVFRRNQKSLRIDSENPALMMFDPLIMVDQVPVFDLEKFMSLPPAKIKRIDVIEDVYIKGDVRFGGLINLVSRDSDMAGIDLPDQSFFIDYQAMQPPASSEQDQGTEGDRLPDTRNTLFWLPDLVLEKESPVSIAFSTPDYPGEYIVLFRGEGPGGEFVLAETTFVVKKQ